MADGTETDGTGLSGAARILRGVRRALFEQGYRSLPEVTLKSGRRADVLAVNAAHELMIVEIKSSLIDFRTDRKWPEYRDWCDRFCFAVNADFPADVIPEDCGLWLADGYGAALLRTPPLHRVAPTRRRAVLLTLALTACSRLHRLDDPWVGAADGG